MTETTPGSGSSQAEHDLADAAQRRRLVDKLFDAALDVPPGDRRALLDERCPTSLRPDVERLLAAVSEFDSTADANTLVREGGALLGAFGSQLAGMIDDDAPLHPGDRVGPYLVQREIGRGGMAAVYLAERDDGAFEQKVALKVALTRYRKPRSRARFELERQILAGLRHPGIAQLLDGGVTADGHPYFAMEWVDGRAIDRYCDDEKLTIDERLKLFVEVGRAVEAAHRSLVVHRDIKPNNVLVTDGRRAKLLDFGIAKVLVDEADTGAFGAIGLTRTEMPMTPDYASPEQLTGEPLTTAVDVYQLGLLLFELLCGRHPFAQKSLVERIASDHTPSRPSLLLATSEAREIADRRSTDLRSLRRKLSGDLETIVLTALRREPERRYSSVRAMADDVQAFLDGRPIAARADSLAYRTRKFVGRHLGATIAVTASFLLLVAVIALSVVRLRQERDAAEVARALAERSQAESEQVVNFLIDLFEVSEGGAVRAESITALDLLEQGTQKIDEDLSETPLVRARLLETLGWVYKELTLFDQSADLMRQSLEIREAVLGPESLEVASSLEGLGSALMNGGHRNEALPMQQRSVAIRERLLPPDDPRIADSLETLATAFWYQGQYAEVEPLLLKALEVRAKAFGETSRETLSAHRKLGILLRTLDRPEEALVHAQKAVDIGIATEGPVHPVVANALNALALLQVYMGHYEEAEDLYRRAIDIYGETMGADSIQAASMWINLGGVFTRSGRLEEARDANAKGLAIREAALDPTHPDIALALNNLANSYKDLEEYAEAEPLFRRAVAIFDTIGQLDHPEAAWPLKGLGEVLGRLGNFEEAERLIRSAIEIREKSYGEGNVDLATSYFALADLYRRQERFDEAQAYYDKALAKPPKGGDMSKWQEIVDGYEQFQAERKEPAEVGH